MCHSLFYEIMIDKRRLICYDYLSNILYEQG